MKMRVRNGVFGFALLATALVGAVTAFAEGKGLGGCDFAFTPIPAMRFVDGRYVFNAAWAGSDPRRYMQAGIDLKPFAGERVRFSCTYRGRAPEGSALAVKFMLRWEDEDTGKPNWREVHGVRIAERPEGVAEFIVSFYGPKPAAATLFVGLWDNAPGEVSYDPKSIRVERVAPPSPQVNRDLKCRYSERVKSLPRLRGVMLGDNLKESDYADLAAMGATLVRYQMHATKAEVKRGFKADAQTREDMFAGYDLWIDGRLDYLESTLVPAARKYGFKVVVDHHGSVGNRLPGGELRMVHDRAFADKFVATWARIAARCVKFADVLYGYDLQNEPVQDLLQLEGCDYWTCQKRAAEAVRAIDPKTPIIVEAAEWDAPNAFRYLSPLDMDDIIYQVHLYQPGSYTHQGIHTDQGIVANKGQKYGKCWPRPPQGGEPAWDYTYVKRNAQTVRDFELRHGAKIFVGEFSAAAWAPGAENYIGDVIALCEEYGWDWTYHAYREATCWSVEHASDPSGRMEKGRFAHPAVVPSADTPRRCVLLDGFRGIVHKSSSDRLAADGFPLLVSGGGRCYELGRDLSVSAEIGGCGNIHRAWRAGRWTYYSNGSLWRVTSDGTTRQCVYRAPQGEAVFGFEVLADGGLLVADNAADRVLEFAAPADDAQLPLDPKSARVSFPVNAADAQGKLPGAHTHLRMIRKTPQGTCLVCAASAGFVREYDRTGRLVWEQEAKPLAFEAVRLANGNTLVAHLDAITEFMPDHRIAWRFTPADAPALNLRNLCGIFPLADGSLAVGTYANGAKDGSRATAFLLDRKTKAVTWHYSSRQDRNMMTVLPR